MTWLADGSDVAGRRLGKLVLGHRIGGGGMGDVFLATREGAGGFQREVVVKLIRAGKASPEAIELFRREGLALAGLSHRNVVQVIELDRDQGDFYLAMEYLRGVDLRDLSRGVGLPWEAAFYIAAEAAHGLAAAHDVGLIHGDVSPSNVMACVDGAVKVLDFGLARTIGDELPEGMVTAGKPSYMAPELALGATPDARTDVYALGATLYHLLTGEAPVRGATREETLELARRAAIAPPSAKIAGLPAGLDAIVMASLARDRAARPRSAARFADELERFLAGRFGAAALARLVAQHTLPRSTEDDGTATIPMPGVGHSEPNTFTVTKSTSGSPSPPWPRRRPVLLALGLAVAGAGAYVVRVALDEPAPPARSAAHAAAPAATPTSTPETAPPLAPPAAAPMEAVAPDAAPAPAPAPAPAAAAKPAKRPPAKGRKRVAREAAEDPSALTPPPGGGLSPGTLADPFRPKP